MSDTSNQKMSKKEPPYWGFYDDDNEFCYEDPLSRICVNPKKIFTSTFKLIQDGIPRNFESFEYYLILYTYFKDPVSKKYIVMLDKSEWTFWFNHVITELGKLQTSPRWKQDGEVDFHNTWMLRMCNNILNQSHKLKLSERSFQVPDEFFYALASCLDALSPRLPSSDCVPNFVNCVTWLAMDSEGTIWNVIERSGLLVHIIRCSTIPLNDETFTTVYYLLTRQLSLIKKKFKPGQPCRDIVQKILAREGGYSNPDPRVLNFLQTISQLADRTNQDLPLYRPKRLCSFCKTTLPENLILSCGRYHMVSYCSKECQRNDWRDHKPSCREGSGLRNKNYELYATMACKFLTDHQDEIKEKIKKTMNETGHEIDELVLDLDLSADDYGIVPILLNQFEILSVDKLLQTRSPGQLPEDLKSMTRDLNEANRFLCLYHSPLGYHDTSMAL